MDAISLVKLLGGLGLFLYGMLTMGNALEKLAGEKLERTLEVMTGNIFKAVGVGTLVTAIIQSSSATTVMVVGFVNAGILSLKQAVGVILGANIGTTVTAQLLRFDSTGAVQDSLLMQLLKPSVICYVLIIIGAVLIMFSKKRRRKDLGEILLGLGVLFVGMSIMEGSVSALRDLPWFRNLFAAMTNPLLGILAGMLVTAVIQSSSASVGILQAVAATGAVKYSAAIPIILGQNIGTCVTALLSALGGNKNAKRAAMIHFYFNLIGTILFIAGVYTVRSLVDLPFWDQPINKGGIANFHTLFNVCVTLIFIPFNRVLVWLAEKTIRSKEVIIGEDLDLLDERFYETPVVALEQCGKVVASMGVYALINVQMVNRGILEHKPFHAENFRENENYIDRCEARLSKYMLGIKGLSEKSKRAYEEMMHVIGDFERIGDYAENLLDQYDVITAQGLSFSSTAAAELGLMQRATEEILELTNDAFTYSDSSASVRIEALEGVIDAMRETLKSQHIMRLQNGECTVNTGIPFLDIIHNYEKISDHCSNIGVYVAMYADEESDRFDIHEYRKVAQSLAAEKHQDWVQHYEEKYLKPIM